MNQVPPRYLSRLRDAFGEKLQENVVLANYTTARVGGPAAALLPVHTTAELELAVRMLWEMEIPFFILGSGSNVLVSDEGYPGVVVINRARNVKIDLHHEPPTLWAESGANLGAVARQAALRGLSGLEWASTIPGTVGGAVVGNAGAHGGDMAGNLLLAEILHPHGKEVWPVERMAYGYRSSALKSATGKAVILSATLKLSHGDPVEIQARMDEFSRRRRSTQPPGASMGSMFKNPPGDYAGRLIEAAGLKGYRSGDAEISPVHANFFINHGHATAAQIGELITTAYRKVKEQFGIALELEVILVGHWPALTGQEQH
ncbi:UDP-N-acetylmuramate dehydrogenase [Anaerolinea thermolimosa]|nr:UDP-N-acetylmuramate dehydrogenase [Anaerolinea thermolimosa]